MILCKGTDVKQSNKICVTLARDLEVDLPLAGPYIIAAGTKIQHPTGLSRLTVAEDTEISIVTQSYIRLLTVIDHT